ncbi:mechanosensitive ion channel family protein [Urechidicola vernalis]|uniref:Mechanosensitive ion channel family protein n=1 Tax=Urechidicola vernalis TaxID=3075600 RepID=A0ABU2Y187_9FLAO|nr:mechanosensitive ion channel family protein [Urechidicola sp. P050]MDT0551946.1 mechanosensitive ion channel family protein [Urechidicola sp. P050]
MPIKQLILTLCLFPAVLFAQDSIPEVNNDSLIIQLKPVEREVVSAPIVLKGDTIFYVQNWANTFPVEVRSEEVTSRLQKLTKWYDSKKDSIYAKQINDYIAIMYNDDVAFIVTESDASIQQVPLNGLAEVQLVSFINTLNKVEVLSTEEWLKRIGYFAVSLLVLIGFIKLINYLFRRLDKRLSKIEKSFLRKKRNILKYFIPKNTANIFVFLSKIVRIALIVITLFFYAPFMFSFFPWAEKVVHTFYGYISTPVKFVVFGFIDFIPSLFFIIVIGYLARYIVRVLKEIALDVELGNFKITNFHKDWARPTEKIVSIFIYAFALVLIFPYLPGSGSTAFQGVSIFIGAIISFGSTSAIANIIAGIVITYMRPFKIGDRVKIGGIIGDVIDRNTLVTSVRTPKNEDITIPNANILTGNIINYSNNKEANTILYTTITLGYDLPWRKAEELLLQAADRTKLILDDPKPFVLKTSLDDFYVSYQLNVSTKEAKRIPWIYSEIHKNILDVFDEGGVEILSPGYMAARDGSLTTVPSQLKPEDKSPLHKITDHLTGRNQKVTIKKRDEPNNE